MAQVFEFNRAIVRDVPLSVADGLRAIERGAPSYKGVAGEHAAYVRALEDAGAAVEVLAPLDACPDSLFVEDPALAFPGAAIVLAPGAPSRRGEAAAIAPALRERFERVLQVERGTVEGGDVLATARGVFIGKSARTSAEGAASLTVLLGELGLRGLPVDTPKGVLHFKSDCSLLDEETILATARLAASGVLADFRIVVTPQGEEGAANAVRVNERVLMSEGYPRTADLLREAGYMVVTLDTREIAKIDAGLSCMSLRWRA